MRIRPLISGVAAVLLCATVGLVVRAALGGDEGGRRAAPAGAAFPVRAASTDTAFSLAAAQTHEIAAGASLIATARTRIVRVHRSPRGGARGSHLLRRRIFHGQAIPLTFLVLDHRPGWLHVALPGRPNRSMGWIRRKAARLTTTRLSIVVQLRRHRLELRSGRRVVLRAAIAVGRSLSPTPHGRYFVTDLVRPRNPRGFYGPYALGLSAHSPVYTSFEGGDGQIGIHGTSNPGAVGSDVSHGCIRLRNAVIVRLAHRVPLGTPVTIA